MCSYHITAKLCATTVNYALKIRLPFCSYALLITQCYKCARNFSVVTVIIESVPIGKKPHIVCPNNQLHTEKSGGHCASFVAIFCLLHSITDK